MKVFSVVCNGLVVTNLKLFLLNIFFKFWLHFSTFCCFGKALGIRPRTGCVGVCESVCVDYGSVLSADLMYTLSPLTLFISSRLNDTRV